MTRYSHGSGLRFPVTQRALGEHLDREQFLARKTEGRREYRVRAQGRAQWCWAIPAVVLFPDTGNSENDENAKNPEIGNHVGHIRKIQPASNRLRIDDFRIVSSDGRTFNRAQGIAAMTCRASGR